MTYTPINVEEAAVELADIIFKAFLESQNIPFSEVYETVDESGKYYMKESYRDTYDRYTRKIESIIFEHQKEEDDGPDNEAGADNGNDTGEGQ